MIIAERFMKNDFFFLHTKPSKDKLQTITKTTSIIPFLGVVN